MRRNRSAQTEFSMVQGRGAPIAGEEYTFPEEGSLNILKATADDAGNYSCEAYNSVGTSKEHILVKIFLSPKIVPMTNVTSKKDEPVKVECYYSGGEPLTAKWFSSHGEVAAEAVKSEDEESTTQESTAEANQYVSTGTNSVILNIRKPSVDDSGEYQCRVSNKAGNATSSSFVKIEHAPTLLSHSSQFIRAIDTSSLELTCTVDALPLAKWTWYDPSGGIVYDSDDIVVSHAEDQKKSSLKIKQAAGHYGRYKCSAENAHGTDEWTMEVLKVELPPTPEVEVTGVFPTKASLVLKNYASHSETPLDENSRPNQIEVTYAKTDPAAPDAQADELKQSEPSLLDYTSSGVYDVFRLEPDTEYTLTVKGVNEAGSSEPSSVKYKTSKPEAPASPGIITTNFTECLTSSCTVQWSPANDNGAAITKYNVMYAATKFTPREQPSAAGAAESDTPSVPTDQLTEQWVKLSVEPDAQQVELKDLLPKTTYLVRVYAQNGIGDSAPAPDLYIKTREYEMRELAGSGVGVNAAAIVAIVIAVVLIFVLIVDVACYFVNQCGLLMCVLVNCCGKTPSDIKAKEIDMEQGKLGPEDKKPLNDVDDGKMDQGEEAPMIIKEKGADTLKKDTPV